MGELTKDKITSHFTEVLGQKIHYLKTGEGIPIVFLHGNPTSSYLWRNIIPHVSGQGMCIAPDLIGMGKSAKPESDYGFFESYKYVETLLIDKLGLKEIVLVGHDWGSAIAFHFAKNHPKLVKGIVFMEAIINAVPDWDSVPDAMKDIFSQFRTAGVGEELLIKQNMFVEQILPMGILRKLSDEEMNTYRAPFEKEADRKPVWKWPNELPIAGEPKEVVEAVNAYNMFMQETAIPKLLLYAEPGGIMPKPLVDWCEASMKNITVKKVGEGVHYIQEDCPDEIGQAVSNWLEEL
ncbi:haloalkane dehalogenase [Leptobacterium sp. I13]|uniref:haloalkane dehalogenase n=1 Tax=Leptobacterium meishanense TaxID=3128904 RepID=UPI0030ED361C